MQRVITLDSQILNTISLCERKTQYTFIDSIAPIEKGEALERGDLMHKMQEIYEGLRCNLVNEKSDTWQTIKEFGLNDYQVNDQLDAKEFTIRAARMFATKMDISQEEIEEVIHQFEDYTEFYKDDPWETLAVESVGTKVLYESEQIKFLYAFKIDRIARKDNLIVPWDYKTSKQRKQTSSLSNQFIGYAWATDSNYVIIDKIGFQKTLKPAERFQRIFLSYDNERIEEWVRNSIQWSFAYAQLLSEPENSAMNLTSCDKYSGCIFRPICESTPSARTWIIKRDFQIKETWDPSGVLKTKKEEVVPT